MKKQIAVMILLAIVAVILMVPAILCLLFWAAYDIFLVSPLKMMVYGINIQLDTAAAAKAAPRAKKEKL